MIVFVILKQQCKFRGYFKANQLDYEIGTKILHYISIVGNIHYKQDLERIYQQKALGGTLVRHFPSLLYVSHV